MNNAQVKHQPIVSPGGMILRSRRKVNQILSHELLKTEEWRYGVTLLEWVQSKKKLQSTELLLSPLFSLLNKCLEFDEQPPVEYSKQLVLSCLLHCCQKLSPDSTTVDTVMKQALNVETLVQCIRASQNPQTHHHALLLLAHIAGIMPEQVLHNVLAIFTFMGSSILRQDDAYSFQVISKIVDTIIPILVKASEGVVEHSSDVDSAVCSVLRVFADTALHIPEHRRLVLFHKILTTLGPENSLWLFLCLVLEEHVMRSQEEQTSSGRRDRGELPPRLDFALNLSRTFSPSAVIITCIKMIKYVQSLPVEKEESNRRGIVRKSVSLTLALKLVPGLFNVELHTSKQLRHFKFTICTFLSTLLSSPSFVNQVAAMVDEATHKLEPLYQDLIENMMVYIECVHHQHETAEQQSVKYWSVMLGLAHDILDKVNALLPSTIFLMVIKGLLDHRLPTVRRRAMELLNTRLYQTSFFTSCNHKALYSLLTPLLAVMGSIGDATVKPDLETNQQIAMLSVKLLARHLAPENPSQFKQILERVTELIQSEAVQKNLLASVVLCLAELVSALRAHAIGTLNQFVPAVIKILHAQKELETPNLVLLSVVTATLKIVESLPHFLSPYLDKILVEVSIQLAKWQHIADDNKGIPVVHKLKAIRQKLLSTVAVRVLTPAVSRCYSHLLAQWQYSALGPLLSVLSDSFSTLSSSEFTQLMPEFRAFFISALQFRADCSAEDPDTPVLPDDIAQAEGYVVDALVALVLKLSESAFRPLYYTLFHWATSSDAHKDRAITFYRLSSSIAECLKGLFVLFAGRLVPNAAMLLDRINVCKSSENEAEGQGYEEASAQLLLQYLLQTLYRVFQHDSGQGFVSKERFDALMQPLVDQVRLAALEVLCEMAHKLGEDFLPLLPETVPFLAELLEDEEEAVESACQKAVQDLEEVLGEPLKKYF
ncbi:HEAT repeat-containing protein 1 [Cryptotermes secundus]|uniref:HEAT repeat-containing protein 1 n=1 Tax=Cryptotermes secundus TaxID=105785 RepID=A0A2J7R0F5_9NEOP|nr:HEAT repeat-containing protein 1 [Cryptotermes secundus]